MTARHDQQIDPQSVAPPPNSNQPAADIDWARATNEPSFRALIRAKVGFIAPTMIIYLTLYLGLTLLAGFAPGFMSQPVLGPINLGYLLIFITYVVVWIVTLAYVRVANRRFDHLANEATRVVTARGGQL